MCPRDFFILLAACNEQQNEEFRQHAELVRLQTTTLVNIQLDQKDHLKPAELWSFDWDSPETSNAEQELTDAQIEAHNARLAAML